MLLWHNCDGKMRQICPWKVLWTMIIMHRVHPPCPGPGPATNQTAELWNFSVLFRYFNYLPNPTHSLCSSNCNYVIFIEMSLTSVNGESLQLFQSTHYLLLAISISWILHISILFLEASIKPCYLSPDLIYCWLWLWESWGAATRKPIRNTEILTSDWWLGPELSLDWSNDSSDFWGVSANFENVWSV